MGSARVLAVLGPHGNILCTRGGVVSGYVMSAIVCKWWVVLRDEQNLLF